MKNLPKIKKNNMKRLTKSEKNIAENERNYIEEGLDSTRRSDELRD